MWVFLAAVAFSCLYALAIIFVHRWHTNRKRERVPTNDRLLRGPGETLRRQLEQMEDELTPPLTAIFVIPGVFALCLVTIVQQVRAGLQIILLLASLVVFVALLLWASRRLLSLIDRRRNTYLGQFGERIVSENLDNLKAGGCRVFHDVPGEPGKDGKTTFNIDHVVVAPTGIFAIETKTRRKGRARQGFAEHEIIFDGQQLSFPWGEDRYGIDQAQRQADWLQKWLKTLLGRELPVQPVLTFPGWMVIERAKGPVRVLNPKVIPALVGARRNEPPVIDAATLDLVARQLDARCRDVEY